MRSCWECSGFEFEDLPTVQDLLREADEGILVKIILEREADSSVRGNRPTKRQVKSAKKRIRKTLREMRNLKTRSEGEGWVIFPKEMFCVDGTSGRIDRVVQATLVNKRDFVKAEKLLTVARKVHTAKQLKRNGRSMMENGLLASDQPAQYAYESDSWKHALAYKVWLRGGFSRKERYMVLADMFQTLTFFGYSFRQTRAKQKEFYASLKALPQDGENETETMYPHAFLFREYGLEASTDDFDSEYLALQRVRANVLNHNALIDLYKREVDLAERIS